MQRIEEIRIESVRGIADRKFPFTLFPNMPHIFVAPNGFGKSSLARAFGCMNQARMVLDDDDLHLRDPLRKPKLTIKYVSSDGQTKESVADATSNDIASVFDIQVITSNTETKAFKKYIGGTMVPAAALRVVPVVLVKRVPPKVEVPNSRTALRKAFGKNGKILPDPKELFVNYEFVAGLEHAVASELTKRESRTEINHFKNTINKLKGSTTEVAAQARTANTAAEFCAGEHVRGAVRVLRRHPSNLDDLDVALIVCQVADIASREATKLKNAIKYAAYRTEKASFQALFRMLKETWKKVELTESKSEGLVAKFPNAKELSNGERDLLSFLAQLQRTKDKLQAEACILVIDEIFDYLDDANLIAAQYYLSRMIEEFREQGRKLFPIILTHLTPGYFSNYAFSRQKVHFLEKRPGPQDRRVEKIVASRGDTSIADALSHHFFHHTLEEDVDLSTDFARLGLDATLSTPTSFKAHVAGELEKYVKEKSYDPIAVCCAVRLAIEKRVHDQLPDEHRRAFVSTKMTLPKLEFAASHGLEIDPSCSLLSVVYNETMHIRADRDNHSSLYSKLEHKVIRKMISVVA